MTAAPVGFQCPECVAAGAVPATRTVFGGRLTRDGAVTYALMGTCGVLFVAISLFGMAGGLERWGMQPLAIALGDQWFRLVSAIFLHGGWLHLGFNLYVLYVLGPPLERVLGHGRFLVLYLLSGLGGSVASYWFSPLRTLSVGASGAIFGLMAAMIVVGKRLDRDVSQVMVLLGINVVLGFVMAGVDWRAHLGGAVTGAVVALALTTGRRQLTQQVIVSVLVAGALVALVVMRTADIRALLPA